MLYSRRMTRAARLQLLSLYENIELVERVLSEMCHSERVGEETCYWVGMAVREALANAIKHGNKLSAEKRVLVEVRLDPGEPDAVERPRCLLHAAVHGRGTFQPG